MKEFTHYVSFQEISSKLLQNNNMNAYMCSSEWRFLMLIPIKVHFYHDTSTITQVTENISLVSNLDSISFSIGYLINN